VDCTPAEHVWEHITPEEGLGCCEQMLRCRSPGGYLRVVYQTGCIRSGYADVVARDRKSGRGLVAARLVQHAQVTSGLQTPEASARSSDPSSGVMCSRLVRKECIHGIRLEVVLPVPRLSQLKKIPLGGDPARSYRLLRHDAFSCARRPHSFLVSQYDRNVGVRSPGLFLQLRLTCLTNGIRFQIARGRRDL